MKVKTGIKAGLDEQWREKNPTPGVCRDAQSKNFKAYRQVGACEGLYPGPRYRSRPRPS